jgi:nucleoside-diphosphate-sugar epimerase
VDTVALTGGTGFIGAAVARRLTAAGWKVRLLVRPGADARKLAGASCEQVSGALENPAALQELVRDAVAVVHCAGTVRGTTLADFEQVNVDGLARLIRVAAIQTPPPRFLALSSLAARQPELSAYAASKRRGEEMLAAEAGAMPWLILRPPAVYGPGDRELLPLFLWMRRGILPVLGVPEARFSLIFVEDLVSAILQWLQQPAVAGGPFELHDGCSGGYGWDDLAAVAAELRSGPVRRLPIPGAVLTLLGQVNIAAARLRGHAPMLSPGKVRELRYPDWVCDNTAVQRALDWSPRVDLVEGLRRTLDWGRS